jgi:hypothetical protein
MSRQNHVCFLVKVQELENKRIGDYRGSITLAFCSSSFSSSSLSVLYSPALPCPVATAIIVVVYNHSRWFEPL